MISYKDIENANSTLHFSDIKGKNYAEVPQRVKAFRMLYPQGFIITEMLSNDGGVCVFRASAGYYGENGEPYTLGTGTAYEREGSSYINKTSYIENCETSAVGRALGFLNIGSDSSIASYEEVANAIAQQADAKKKTDASNDAAFPICDECGRPIREATGGDGKIYTPEQVAQMTRDKYGVALCPGCKAKRKGA